MHEMGIANSILKAVSTEMLLYRGQRAAKIGVVIGEYAGVDTESLRFCFEVLTKGQEPVIELDIRWRTGSDELKLDYLEMEEVADEPGCNPEESLKRERSNSRAVA
jgi:hypothetical protein